MACSIDPTYAKALYRRAQAKRNLRSFDESILDCEKAIQHTEMAIADLGGGAAASARAVIDELTKFHGATTKEREARH